MFVSFAAYKCHGGWKENGTVHQIISSDLPTAGGWRKLYCLTYVKWPPDRVQVFVYADNCNPNNNRTTASAPDEGLVLSFNISLSPSGKSRPDRILPARGDVFDTINYDVTIEIEFDIFPTIVLRGGAGYKYTEIKHRKNYFARKFKSL